MFFSYNKRYRWVYPGFGFRLFCATLLLTYIFAVSPSFGQMQLPPKLESPESQYGFLVLLQKEIPWIFNQGAEYDYDFFQFIESQNALVESLSSDPLFKKLNNRRLPEHTIEIRIENPNSVLKRLPKVTLVRNLERRLKRSVGSDREAAIGTLAKEIRKNLSKNNGISAQAISTGIVNSLPDRLKREFFEMTLESRLLAFRENMTLLAEEVQNNFQFERLGIPPSPFEMLLKMLEEEVENEIETAYDALYLAYLSGTSRKIIGKSVDSESFNLALNHFDYANVFGKKQVVSLKKYLKSYVYSETFTQEDSKESIVGLRATTVPPYLGGFRGLVGGDCSTQNCFGIAFAPGLYTYYLYGSDGILKGYAQWTESTRGPNKYMFLHDVVGSRLSKNDVSMFFEGVLKLSEEFGFDGVVIPSKDQVHDNVNYTLIHSVYDSYRKERVDRFPIEEFPDLDVRSSIARLGHHLQNDDLPSDQVSEIRSQNSDESPLYIVGIEEQETVPFKLPKKVSSSEETTLMLNFLLSISSPEALKARLYAQENAIDGQDRGSERIRGATFEKMALYTDKTSSEFENLFHSINFPDSISTMEAYQKNLADDLTEFLGDKDWKKFREENLLVFARGHLSITGSLDPNIVGETEFKRSVKYLVGVLKRWRHPPIYSEVIKREGDSFDWGPLFQSPSFRNYLVKLVRPDKESLEQLNWILEQGPVPLYLGEKDIIDRLESNEFLFGEKEISVLAKKLGKKFSKLTQPVAVSGDICILDN